MALSGKYSWLPDGSILFVPEEDVISGDDWFFGDEPPPMRITHAVREVLRAGDPKARITHAVREVLRAGDPKVRITHAVREVLRSSVATIPITADLDALLKATGLTETADLDALLTGVSTKTTDLDALLKEIGLTETTDLDAYLKAAGLTEGADLDAYLKKLFPTTTDLDAYIKAVETLTADLDAYLKGLFPITTAMDAIVITGNTIRCYGEETPDPGSDPVGWDTWSDGDGGSPTVIGDAEWGKLQLLTDEIAHGPVHAIGAGTHPIKVTQNGYGSGTGSFTVYIRGQAASFNQDDGVPSWEEYTAPTSKTWEYLQVKLEGN